MAAIFKMQSLAFSPPLRLLCDPLFQCIIDNSDELELMGEREAEIAAFQIKGG